MLIYYYYDSDQYNSRRTIAFAVCIILPSNTMLPLQLLYIKTQGYVFMLLTAQFDSTLYVSMQNVRSSNFAPHTLGWTHHHGNSSLALVIKFYQFHD